ncbi:hypothetical protein BJ980_000782 [Nocardioides daedukensis]|uniref:DUF3159 domain-containing protein n=1 Tax=Nocardioides daedukensis TaxID=634462 RepID=A0A7Y9RYX5_9ACTN|nr:hypothetical protein [Nocardioides daedukensis]
MNQPAEQVPEAGETQAHATPETVEMLVRQQLSKALGGGRGMVEAAVPTIVFTALFLTTKDLRLALIVSAAIAALALLVRLVQRSTIQFAVNALVGIGIGAFFAMRAAKGGGDANDQVLAYFLPGILYNAGYAVVLSLTNIIRWPLVGFMVGSVTGEPTEWRQDRQLVRLCQRLTWLLVAPCLIRVVVQAPIYLAATGDAMDPDVAVAVLGLCKFVMGWPLQLAALGAMVWLLSRNATPIEKNADPA